MNGIEVLIQRIKKTTLVSETDVRTQVAVPLLELLGYPSANRAEEFPIRGLDGRSSLQAPLRAKRADIVLFNSTKHSEHRKPESLGWVADHALVVVELKKPGEPLANAKGQAQFYAHWAKVPFYVMTNGEEIVVYRMQSFFDDVREMHCAVKELPREWGRISSLLGFEAVKRYSDLDATITVEASPWVSSKAVERLFRKAQVKVMGTSGGRPPGSKKLTLFRFVIERRQSLSEPAAKAIASRAPGHARMPEGKELVREWNKTYSQWEYKTEVGDPHTRWFWKDFKRILKTIAVGPPYQGYRAAAARQPRETDGS